MHIKIFSRAETVIKSMITQIYNEKTFLIVLVFNVFWGAGFKNYNKNGISHNI